MFKKAWIKYVMLTLAVILGTLATTTTGAAAATKEPHYVITTDTTYPHLNCKIKMANMLGLILIF